MPLVSSTTWSNHVTVGAGDHQARTLGVPEMRFADTRVTALESYLLAFPENSNAHINLPAFPAFAQDAFIGVLDALALVGFRSAQLADVGGNLAHDSACRCLRQPRGWRRSPSG